MSIQLRILFPAFADWRIEKMQTRFKYTRSNQPVTETALTYKDGTPREVIKQGNVGTMFVEGTPSDKYLYNRIAFDSPLEKENIMTDIDEVVVYGKIPKIKHCHSYYRWRKLQPGLYVCCQTQRRHKRIKHRCRNKTG